MINRESNADAEIVAAYRKQLQAMQDGDTETLDKLLADGSTFTHITGYVQSKEEWLAEMQSGQFQYFGWEEDTLEVTVNEPTARLLARVILDAEVYGSRAKWKLQADQEYERVGTEWKVTNSVSSTW